MIEILLIVAVVQAGVMLMLPAIAAGVSAHNQMLLSTVLLVFITGPAIFWRCRVEPTQAVVATPSRSLRSGSVSSAIAMTAAAQVLGLVLTGACVIWQRHNISAAAQEEFDRNAERIEVEVQRHFDLPLVGLNGLRGMFAAGSRVTRTQFRAWVESRNLPTEFPGVQGFGFIERVERGNLGAFVAAQRADESREFTIDPVGNAPDLYVVKYIEPMASNRAVLGMDAGREAVRREAAERAVFSGMPALSGHVVLTQDGVQRPGFLYFTPVYRSGSSTSLTARERQSDLVGLLYAPIVATEIMKGVNEVVQGALDVELFDGESGQPGDLLFRSRVDSLGDAKVPGPGFSDQARQSVRTFVVGGRTFALRVTSTPAFEALIDSSSIRFVAVGGVLTSFLMALTVWLLAVGRVRALRRAQRMTADLARLARVVQHTSNSVVITDAQMRINWVNEGFTRITGYTLEEAAGRMPGDLLSCDNADPMTLKTLLKGVTTGETCRVEVLNRAKDGHEYWIDTEIKPTRDEHGVLTGFMEVGSDITVQKHTRLQLEAAMRESDALLRTLHQHAIVSVADRAGKILEVNEAFCHVSGYSRQELLGQNHRIVNSEVQPREFWIDMWRTISGGSPWRGEICNRAKDGSLYWVDSMIAPFMTADGTIEKYVSIRTDISASKTAQQQLGVMADRLTLAIEGGSDGLWDWMDVNGEAQWWSPSFYAILGYQSSQLVAGAGSFQSLLHASHRAPYQAAIGEALAGGNSFDMEFLVLTHDGGYRWFRSRAKVSLDAAGRATRMAGSMQDIHDRKQAERELARERQRLGHILEGTNVGTWEWDIDTGKTDFNERWAEITGHSLDELGATTIQTWTQNTHPDDQTHSAVLLEQHFNGDLPYYECETRTQHKDGHWVWVLDRGKLFARGDDGRPRWMAGTRMDITQRKQAEGLLREALTQAEQASVTKSQFLANMSHEIRTPMNAILGMLSLLQRTSLSVRQLDYASKTEGAARSLLGLLNDILDFSKAEAGKMSLDPRPFQVDRLLRDLSVILSANVRAKTIDVLFDIDPAVPPCLLGDDMRLQQVLINLSGNAVKFTEAGEVVLSLKVLERTDDDVLLEFAIRDSGIGIAPENQAHIFTGFSQAEASTTRRFGGTGLGLAISQRLVALMGGELGLQSTLGEGSTFHFQIRLAIASTAADEPVAPRPVIGRVRTLIVDDNESAREVFVAMAQSLGWLADGAASGVEAIALAQSRAAQGIPYETFLVDWQMPEMDGWETSSRLAQLAQASSGHSPLLIMVTSHGREALAHRSADEQALLSGFLVKPVTASMLSDAVSAASTTLAHPEWLNRPMSPPAAQRLVGMRLLIVEDNLNNQQVIQELLFGEGAQIILAGNGQLAVDAVAAADPPFDAVLMDLQMPVMDGYTATAEIRRNLGLTKLPIIAMTANAMASDREACLAAGMNDHVGKPFDLSNLVDVLLRHTGRVAMPVANARPRVSLLQTELIEQAKQQDIDLAAAVGRMGGNVQVYLRSLQSFADDLAALPDQLATLVQQGRFNEAGRLMHTVKGLASTLGLRSLSSLAAATERSLGGADISTQQQVLIEQLRAAATSTLQDITLLVQRLRLSLQSAVLKSETVTDVDPKSSDPRQRLCSSLDELIGLLRGADMRALKVFEKLQETHAAHIQEVVQPLDDAMAVLDFDLALSHCQALRKRFDQ